MKVCLDCPKLIASGSRCETHRRLLVAQRSQRRGTRQAQGYGSSYQQARRETIQAQPWCDICGSTDRLTADHIIPLAIGGATDGPLRTLCAHCNASLGSRLGNQLRAARRNS